MNNSNEFVFPTTGMLVKNKVDVGVDFGVDFGVDGRILEFLEREPRLSAKELATLLNKTTRTL